MKYLQTKQVMFPKTKKWSKRNFFVAKTELASLANISKLQNIAFTCWDTL